MRGSPYVFTGFQTGINLEAAPYFLDAGQARDTLNVHTSPVGAIVKRPGSKFEADVMTVNPEGVFGCQLAAGDKLLIHAGEDFYENVAGAATVTKLAKAKSLTKGYDWEWVQAPTSGGQGPIYGVNGKDKPMYWTGAGEVKEWTAEAGSIPNGKVIAFWENRVWIANESTVYWSDITNPRNFESPKGGSTKIDPEDGEFITAFGVVGGYLIVFKEHKTFLITDSNTGAYRRISSGIGCISPRSVVETPSGTFFLTPEREIVLTNGQAFNREIGEEIAPAITEKGSVRKACAVTNGQRVYFSVPTESNELNDLILEYDLGNKSWWKHRIYWGEKSSKQIYGGVRQFAVVDPSDVEGIYGLGQGGEGKDPSFRVANLFSDSTTYGDGNKAFEWYWVSPWHVFTYPHIRKIYREIRVDSLGNYSLGTSFSFSKNLLKEDAITWDQAESEQEEGEWGVEEEGIKWGESKEGEVWGGPRGVITEKRFYTPGEGRAMSIKLYGEDTYPLEIYAYTVLVNYRKD